MRFRERERGRAIVLNHFLEGERERDRGVLRERETRRRSFSGKLGLLLLALVFYSALILFVLVAVNPTEAGATQRRSGERRIIHQ